MLHSQPPDICYTYVFTVYLPPETAYVMWLSTLSTVRFGKWFVFQLQNNASRVRMKSKHSKEKYFHCVSRKKIFKILN